MDRTRTHDDEQTMVSAIENPANLLAGFTYVMSDIGRGGQLRLELRRCDQQLLGDDIEIFELIHDLLRAKKTPRGGAHRGLPGGQPALPSRYGQATLVDKGVAKPIRNARNQAARIGVFRI